MGDQSAEAKRGFIFNEGNQNADAAPRRRRNRASAPIADNMSELGSGTIELGFRNSNMKSATLS